ncbi:MAG: protein translocase subunit SecF [Oligoflexia bacterium]|nr:protein translocase subunit SecF [Oligoflexia bacterium]
MIEIIKHNVNINFAKYFNVFTIISTVLVLTSFGLIFFKGLNYGVDFRGGAEIQTKFKTTIKLEDLRNALADGGFSSASVQSIGSPEDNEFLIKVLAQESNLNAVTQQISSSLQKRFADSGMEIRKTDIVGPKAGEELRIAAVKAILYSFIAIMIYVGLRFDFKYAPGAVLALIHDSALVAGIWALFGFEFSLQTVAALLTIIGYSVNDTVVVYDRVREHEEKNPGVPMVSLLNTAVNETLSRTILTASATLLSALAMYIWGGESIRDFFLAISIGIVVGTYSTIYIAASITIVCEKYNLTGKKLPLSATAPVASTSAKAIESEVEIERS